VNVDPSEHEYCFTMTTAQFRTILLALDEKLKISYSTNPADYSLTLFVMNMENWLPWARGDDPRMGLSFRDMSIKSIP
jgi:hypothetical protein